MHFKNAVIAGALSVCGSVAFAQEFTGGTLGLEYTAFDGANGTSYDAGVEFSINRQIGTQLDIEHATGGGDSASSATFHGIYHLSNTSSVGAFYGQNLGGDLDYTTYGIEGGTLLWGRSNFGGYLGQQQFDGGSSFILGVNAETPLSESFEVYSDFDFALVDDVWVSTSEVGEQYSPCNGPELFAHFGSLSAGAGGATASTEYLGVGARINFGARRGTTFEGR